MDRIYMDWAASAPLCTEALEAMMPYLRGVWGNASSIHSFGREARRAIEEAREEIASFIGAQPDEIFFTSGGTESDNWAVTCGAESLGADGRVLTSPIEHHAVLNACAALQSRGVPVRFVACDRLGRVDPEEIRESGFGPQLVSVMTANNEIGTLEPIDAIGAICREKNWLFHTDAVQAVGAVPVNVKQSGADLLSASAHKFGGPKGVGFLFIRRGVKLSPLLRGGAQEHEKRAGTENTAGIVGMAAALRRAQGKLRDREKLTSLRNEMQREILRRIPDTFPNGDMEQRLPGNLNLRFAGADAEALMLRLDLRGVAVSAGAACASGTPEVSHVLRAIGLSEKEARECLRFSLSEENTREEIEKVIAFLAEDAAQIRRTA